MNVSRRYLVAVALLAVTAVVFGVVGTVAPPLPEETAPISPQQGSSLGIGGHFQYPPTYDSGWVDIRNKAGEYFTLSHNLNTTEVIVDLTGKQSLEPMSGVQEWSKSYGGSNLETAYSMIQTRDGGYALAGYTMSYGAGGPDFWLVKTDAEGNEVWNKTYGGTNQEYAYSVIQTTDDGYAIAGYTQSYGAGVQDYWLVKTDSSGNAQWNQTYGATSSDIAYSVIQTSEGGYAIAGFSTSFGACALLIKTDSAGTKEWSQIYGGAATDAAYSLIQTADGGYALAGYSSSFGGGNNFWLVKTASTGTMLWNKTYGGLGTDEARSLIQTRDGGYALAGYTDSFGAGLFDFFFVKTDSAGNMFWNRTYGGTGLDRAYSVVQTRDMGYALAGYTNSSGAGLNDFLFVQTDSTGANPISETYGGQISETAYSVIQTLDGGYALGGYTASLGAGQNDFWIVKVKAEIDLEHQMNLGGTALLSGWSRTYGGTSTDVALRMIQTGDGGYALAGFTRSYGEGQEDFWLVKTSWAGDVLWSRTYGGSNYEDANSLIQTSDEGYALAGFTYSYGVGDRDFWLVKADANGNAQWNRTYGASGTDWAYSVIQTGDEGYALAGYTQSFGPGLQNFWLVKTDAAGNMQWNKTYGGTNSDIAYGVLQTEDGGYILAGQTSSYGAGLADFYLVKTDASGNLQWNRTYGEVGTDVAYSLTLGVDGGYALAGYTNSFGSGYNFWLIKTDASGNMQWNKLFGGAGADYAWSMIQTSEGGYALAGRTNSYGAGDYDFWLIKTDWTGNVQFSKTYGGTNWDSAQSLVQTVDGGYALAGFTYSYGAGDRDFWLVKTEVEQGLKLTSATETTITLYRGRTDAYWNYVRVRIWLVQEPTWMYGDINQDGIVDAKDLYIIGRNYGKTFSLLSIGGIAAIAGIRITKKRKQNKQSNHTS